MSLADAFLSHEALYKAAVRADTWGHLAPKPRQAYPAIVIFGMSAWGEHVLFDCHFAGLDGNPWTCDDMNEFVDRYFERRERSELRGRMYRFVGTYMQLKNGNARFSGKIRRLRFCR